MSGGHFDYQQYRLSDIAEQIDHLVETNNDQTKDKFGDPKGCQFSRAVINRFVQASAMLRAVGDMVHEIDWLVSGDTGEDTFLKTWTEKGLDNPREIELARALYDCLESLRRLDDKDGAFRQTCIQRAEAALQLPRGGKLPMPYEDSDT